MMKIFTMTITKTLMNKLYGHYSLLFIYLLILPIQVYSSQTDLISNKFDMHFVSIPSGSFLMGSTEKEREMSLIEMKMQSLKKHDLNNYRDEQVKHKVIISNSFYIGETEVTQAQWLKIMGNKPGPEEYWQRPDWKNLPVVSISWNMTQEFIKALNKKDLKYNYRLPSEAEWEYVARAGSRGLRPIRLADLDLHAWYFDNSDDEPHPVATLPKNAFGIYDILGNAWEWVNDWYSPDVYGEGSTRIDPRGPKTGKARIRRGGSYHCPSVETRPGFREANSPDTRYTVTGFRLITFPK